MAEAQPGRVLRGKAHANGVAAGKLVETTNSLAANDFFERYYEGSARVGLTALAQSLKLDLTLQDADNLDKLYLDGCLKLIEQSSKDDYIKSDGKWKPTAKKSEMLLPDMKYIILSRRDDNSVAEAKFANIVGFCSFMVTYEDDYEVVYVYEIHLDPHLQGRGMGQALMAAIESIGQQVNVSKAMLTVFRSNTDACQWYEKLGYEVDEFSPGPKVFRNGTIKEPSYLILSRSLR